MISTSRTWKGCSAPVATSSRRGSSAITSLVSTSPSPITSPTPPPITLLSSCTPWLCLFFLLQTVSLSPFPQYFHQQLVTDGKIINAKNMIASIRACLLFFSFFKFVGFSHPWSAESDQKWRNQKTIFCNFLLNHYFYLSPHQYSNLNKRWHFSKPNLTKSKHIKAKNLNLIDIYQDKICKQSLPSSTSSIPSSQLLSVSDVKQSAC